MTSSRITWWCSTNKMTFVVETHGYTIVSAAPIARKFIGQRLQNLVCWLERQGGLKMQILEKRLDEG